MKIFSERLTALLQSANSGKLVLPDFQREFTYKKTEQKKLLASLFCGIPIGTVLTMEGAADSFSHRKIGRKSNFLSGNSEGDRVFLLDGQQRLTTLWNALTDPYEKKGEADKNTLLNSVHSNLHTRWFIKFKKDKDFLFDPWGYEDLSAKLDLRSTLLPDDLDSFLVYDFQKKKITGIHWSGDSLALPVGRLEKGSAESEYRDWLDEEVLMPLHLLSSNAYLDVLNRIGSRRLDAITTEVKEIQDSIRANKILPEGSLRLIRTCFDLEEPQTIVDFEDGDIKETLDHRKTAWVSAIDSFLKEVLITEIGVTKLGVEDLSKSHVIFNVINKAGVALSTFDLFCATKQAYNVRQDLYDIVGDFEGLDAFGIVDTSTELLSKKFTDQVLNILKLVHAYENNKWGTSILKEDERLFKVKPDELKTFLKPAVEALLKAYHLAHHTCGVRDIKKFPYALRVLPVAFLFYLGLEGPSNARAKYFYWITLFSGRYSESQNVRCFEQLDAVKKLKKSGELHPDFDLSGILYEKVLSLDEYNDLASLAPPKGEIEPRTAVTSSIAQWVLSLKPFDFPGGTSIDDLEQRIGVTDELELHHIMPLASASSVKDSSKELRDQKNHYLNSPLNLTLISKKSNRKIGAMSYSDYSSEFHPDVQRTHLLPDLSSEWTKEKQTRKWLADRHKKLLDSIKTKLDSWHELFSDETF